MLNVEYYALINDKHADSTHAEILSVLTVLCTVPTYSSIIIYTVSGENAHESIEKESCCHHSPRREWVL